MESNKDRNKILEAKEAINDNNLIQINEEGKYQYEKTLSELKNMGYINSELILDEKHNPQTILIKNEKQELIAIYNDEGIKALVPEGLALINQFNEQQKEENVNENSLKNSKTNSSKEKLQLDDENNSKEEDEKEEDKKELKNKDAQTKEEFQEEVGDEYVVATEIVDEEISRKLISTEKFIGNPLIGFSKKTNNFVIIGNDGSGKLAEATLLTVPGVMGKTVDKYNYDGSTVEERGIVGKEIMLLPPENNDGLDLKLNEHGELEVNKIVNIRGDNPQSFPVDTKQTRPTTQEISDMKANGEKMEEITKILDEMVTENKISNGEKKRLMEEISNNNNTLNEDKAKLENIQGEKEADMANKDNQEEEYDDSWVIYGKPRSH